jgi:CheY-like chemotaxis protein
MEMQDIKRIVVVDDTQSVAFILKNYLEEEGFSVSAYDDPREALDDITSNGADFIITDYTMPGMNGVELLTRINKQCPLQDAIIISADPDRVNQSLKKYPVIEKSNGFVQKVLDIIHKKFKP